MIVIMVISAFAIFYFRYTGATAEKAMLKQQLNNADVTVNDVILNDSQNLTITFFSGPGFQILMNYSVEEVNYTYINITQTVNTTTTYETTGSFVNVSVVSVADISGSMASYNKIGELRDATRPFINSMLNHTGNKVGLVAYSRTVLDTVQEDHCHELSDDNNSLISTVNAWTYHSQTCICCGINKATEYLQNEEEGSYRVMIVMSDGQANIECTYGGWNIPQAEIDAINAARNAFENYNITVHTIGFGADADAATLQAIAAAGNGSYYFADVSELAEIYAELGEQLIIPVEHNQTVYNYTTETIYQNITTVVYVPRDNYYLKIVFYTEDFTYIQNKNLSDLPGPAEEKEVTLSLDPSWGITTDDLTKIEIYAVIETEEGIEMISDEPIAVWEPEGLY